MCYERIHWHLAQIAEGLVRLVERRWQFETAMADYLARMSALPQGREDLLWSVDAT